MGRDRERLGMAQAFETQSPFPVPHLLPQAIPNNPSQTIPTGDQAFKHMSLWGLFPFKPPPLFEQGTNYIMSRIGTVHFVPGNFKNTKEVDYSMLSSLAWIQSIFLLLWGWEI